MGSGNSGIGFDLEVNAKLGAGTYKATVVADGKLYETNEIVITKKEEKAEILEFTLEDDYTDGTAVVYGENDNKVIGTITLSKNYDGKIELWKANDTKYTAAVDEFTTTAGQPNANATAASMKGAGTDNKSTLINDEASNYQIAQVTAGAALGWYNADGTVTYKVVFDDGTKTRGQDYVVTFDQDSFSDDTPNKGTANVSEAATVPYVVAPAAIEVTKVATGNLPEVTFEDEDGATLAWFGENGNMLSGCGIEKGDVYYADKLTTDTTKANALKTTIATASNVKKGVWTANVTAGTDAYWFAQVTTKKGIFGKDAITLTSEAVQIAKGAADMINLKEKGTDTVDNAKAVTVEFSNLRTDGTVYIVQGTTAHTTPAAIFKDYEDGNADQIVGQASVTAGAASVDVAGVIEKYNGDGKDIFIAVFIPENAADYGMVYTNDGVANTWKLDDKLSKTDNQGLTVKQTAVTLDWDKDTKGKAAVDVTGADAVITLSGTTFKAKDQFGDAMASAQAAGDPALMTAIDKTLTTTEKGTFVYEVGGTGAALVTATLTVQGKAIDLKDGFKFTLLGKEVELTATLDAGTLPTLAADTGAVGDSKELTIKIGGDAFCDTATALATAKATEYAALTALTFAGDNSNATVDVNITGTLTGLTVTASSSDTNVGTISAATQNKPTVTWVRDGSATMTVTVTGNYYKRTTTWTFTGNTDTANSTISSTAVSDALAEK